MRENIGLEVESGIGSGLSIYGNYATSMGFAFFLPTQTLRDVVGKE